MNKRTDKRVRLIEAADKLFYEQGVSMTTLANIASLAEVPLGNVYYYFKSKESIILAVIERRRKTIEAQFNTWDSLSNKARVAAFIAQTTVEAEQNLAFGDWLGNLCQELCKNKNEISSAASALLQSVLTWCETQFKEMGKAEKSHHLALSLLGTSLLTLTFKDVDVIRQQTASLLEWLKTV